MTSRTWPGEAGEVIRNPLSKRSILTRSRDLDLVPWVLGSHGGILTEKGGG